MLGANGATEPLAGQVVPPVWGDMASSSDPAGSNKKESNALKGIIESSPMESEALTMDIHNEGLQGKTGASDALPDQPAGAQPASSIR